MSYELAIVLGFISTSLILGYIGFNLDNKQLPLKVLLITASILVLVLGIIAVRNITRQVGVTADNINNTVNTLYELVLWVIRILVAFFAVWLFVAVIKTAKDIKIANHEKRFGK